MKHGLPTDFHDKNHKSKKKESNTFRIMQVDLALPGKGRNIDNLKFDI